MTCPMCNLPHRPGARLDRCTVASIEALREACRVNGVQLNELSWTRAYPSGLSAARRNWMRMRALREHLGQPVIPPRLCGERRCPNR